MTGSKFKLDWLILPLIGMLVCVLLWHMMAGKKIYSLRDPATGPKDIETAVTGNLPNGAEVWAKIKPMVNADRLSEIKALPNATEIWPHVESHVEEKRVGMIKDLPNVKETWENSKLYIQKPFEKRGEQDQGILRFTWYSLIMVSKGYLLALLIGTPIGFFLGLSKTFSKAFDPIIQILRPVSPLAWLPLGLVLFQKPQPSALFTIALCAMWPTVLNTAVGVRAIPQDFLNVAKVLKLSRTKTLFKVMIPATLPYMFTGFRLSLGIAWLVIVAAEMLTGSPGVGGFLWQEYNSLIYEHIILCILTIGIIGFILDRLMGLVEKRFKTA